MGDTGESANKLTGVWHGLYSYPVNWHMPESHFVATLIDGGAFFSGTIHENMIHKNGSQTPGNALVEGTRSGNDITFMKTYDGTSGLKHSVMYVGQLSADGLEIEGIWRIHSHGQDYSGRFLMIRNRGSVQAEQIKIAEKV